MEDLIIDQLNNVDGKIVLSLGRKLNDNGEEKMNSLNSNVKLYPFLPGQQRELIMNKSKIIVSRSGYSTLMDVYALDKKALFVPTPQQTEQQYLAKHHEKMGNFLYVNQDEMDLQKDLKKAMKYKGPDKHYRMDKNIEKFMDTIYA
jgi:UDP-N-acetylglucosamine:LPS N-acetylglucosamine transferase